MLDIPRISGAMEDEKRVYRLVLTGGKFKKVFLHFLSR